MNALAAAMLRMRPNETIVVGIPPGVAIYVPYDPMAEFNYQMDHPTNRALYLAPSDTNESPQRTVRSYTPGSTFMYGNPPQ